MQLIILIAPFTFCCSLLSDVPVLCWVNRLIAYVRAHVGA
jgi:hypothetical protein